MDRDGCRGVVWRCAAVPVDLDDVGWCGMVQRCEVVQVVLGAVEWCNVIFGADGCYAAVTVVGKRQNDDNGW